MTAFVIALWGAMAAADPAALFWSEGRSWLVDLGPTPRLLGGDGWVVPAGTSVRRYRRRVETSRDPAAVDGALPPARRRTIIERAGPGNGSWTPVGPRPWADDAGAGAWDERAVLQFTGESVVLARFLAQLDAHGQRRFDTAAAALDLPLEREAPAVAGPEARLNPLAERCALRPTASFALQGPGGAARASALLSPSTGACPGESRLVIAPAPPGHLDLGRALLDRTTFRTGPRVLAEDVVDLRASVDHKVAVLLIGAPLPGMDGTPIGPLDLADPCVRRRVVVWRAPDPDRLIDVGEAARLDGLRFLAADDPALPVLRQSFLWPVGVPCHAPAGRVRGRDVTVDGDAREWPDRAAPSAHACRIEEGAHPWGGPDDLAAAVTTSFAAGKMAILIEVKDPVRAAGDRVRVWVGSDRRPLAFEVGPAGLVPADKSKPLPDDLAAVWRERPDGYLVEIGLPAATAGEPPSLSVRIDDADGPGDERVSLWAAGAPIDERRLRAAPVAPEARP